MVEQCRLDNDGEKSRVRRNMYPTLFYEVFYLGGRIVERVGDSFACMF